MNGKFVPYLSLAIPRRLLGAALACALLLTLLIGGAASAQTNNRKIKVGDSVNGTFDARIFAQTYSFDATTGDVLTLTAKPNTRGLLLALLLTDSNGATIEQVANLSSQDVLITDFKPNTGTYYITVLRATGVQGNTASSFTLSLSGTLAADNGSGGNGGNGGSGTVTPVQTVELAQGLTVSLAWASTDDLNLEVRDPIGGAVNLNNTVIASGGRLSGNVNGDCATATNSNPTERVQFPNGAVPTGSYEIIIYYVKACASPAAANAFTATINANGNTTTVQGELQNVGQNYVASFSIDAPDKVTVRQGGLITGIDVNPFLAKITAPIATGTSTSFTGRISATNAADVYALDIVQGESFSVAMNAVNGGSLDPYLVLLGPTNQIITDNDDANENTRNALLSVRNANAGTYKVVATRFGLANGGTEGSYAFAITRGSGGQIVAPLPTSSGGNTALPTVVAANTTPLPTLAVDGTVGALPRGSIEALLTWNSRADLRILIRDPRGQSLYTDVLKVDSGGALVRTGNLNCNSTTITPASYAYWNTARPPAGTYEIKVFLQSTCNDTAPTLFSLKVNVNGKEVINIANQPPGAEKEVFLTTFTVDANSNAIKGPDGFVTNNFATDISGQITTARQLTYGGSIDDEISTSAFYKVYFFQGFTGDVVTITMKRGTNNVLDSYLVLLDPDGKSQLTFNDDASVANGQPGGPVAPPDSQMRFTLTKDGNHIIVATRYGIELGGTVGKFRLTLSR